jgi:hypothetical protein
MEVCQVPPALLSALLSTREEERAHHCKGSRHVLLSKNLCNIVVGVKINWRGAVGYGHEMASGSYGLWRHRCLRSRCCSV